MRHLASTLSAAAFALLTVTLLAPNAAHAQATAETHIGHVMEGFRGTPEGQGLLPTAIAEAAVAQTHAGLMVRDLTNLGAMQTHAGHVLHALDPEVVENGPGNGYGLRQAAAGVAQHIGFAAGVDGAPGGVATHAPHVIASATNTANRAEQMIELANGIRAATDAGEAGGMAQRLNRLAQALTAGIDANEDGRVGWQEGEGGLDIVSTHMGLMTGR